MSFRFSLTFDLQAGKEVIEFLLGHFLDLERVGVEEGVPRLGHGRYYECCQVRPDLLI